MRWFSPGLVAVALLSACSPPHTSTSDKAATTHSKAELARQTLQTIAVDSGVAAATTRAALEKVAVDTRRDVVGAPAFSQLPSNTKQDLLAFLDAFPTIATNEVMTHTPQVVEEYAPQLAAMFDEEEMQELQTYYRSVDGRSWLVRAAEAEARGQQATPTSSEQIAIGNFARTRAGRALDPEFNRLLHDLGYRLIEVSSAQINAQLHDGICSRIPCEPATR